MKMEKRLELRSHKPRNTWGYQKLEEARKDPLWRLPRGLEGNGPANTLISDM